MRREFIVRVTATLLVVSVSHTYLIYTSMHISILYYCIEIIWKYTKTMKMKNNLMCIVCHSRVRYVFIGDRTGLGERGALAGFGGHGERRARAYNGRGSGAEPRVGFQGAEPPVGVVRGRSPPEAESLLYVACP